MTKYTVYKIGACKEFEQNVQPINIIEYNVTDYTRE